MLDMHREIKTKTRYQAAKIREVIRAAGGAAGRIYREKDGTYRMYAGKGLSAQQFDHIVLGK